jgi:hypothetical protein
MKKNKKHLETLEYLKTGLMEDDEEEEEMRVDEERKKEQES